MHEPHLFYVNLPINFLTVYVGASACPSQNSIPHCTQGLPVGILIFLNIFLLTIVP